MSFKNYDKQNFIIDTANAFTKRKISKRDFLSKMGIAGIGMSAFATGDDFPVCGHFKIDRSL